MASINEKLNYINETKTLIKDKLNDLGSEIDNETTFREYVEKIEDLYNEWPRISDEDVTITLNNTKKGKMNLQLKGNTSQTIYNGKNVLLNIRDEGYTVTSNGITFKVNADKSITVSGTATGTASMSLNKGTPVTLTAGTYTLSKKENSDVQIAIWYDSASVWTAVRGSLKTVQKTISEDTTFNNWRTIIAVYEGVTVNTTIYPMLEKSSTETSYEPYTGGIPSPNPDYPQDIQVVTGENTIIISNEGNTENQTFDIDLGDLELCKINNIQDYIYKNNNKWYKKPMILKINNYNEETISTNYISTTGELSMNATVYYINPTLNPNGIQIKDEILINELNILEQAMSYNNQTNISQENDNLPFIINATALMKNSD